MFHAKEGGGGLSIRVRGAGRRIDHPDRVFVSEQYWKRGRGSVDHPPLRSLEWDFPLEIST